MTNFKSCIIEKALYHYLKPHSIKDFTKILSCRRSASKNYADELPRLNLYQIIENLLALDQFYLFYITLYYD